MKKMVAYGAHNHKLYSVNDIGVYIISVHYF
jgi:hypothetical protein